jgi:hypothetical protein
MIDDKRCICTNTNCLRHKALIAMEKKRKKEYIERTLISCTNKQKVANYEMITHYSNEPI